MKKFFGIFALALLAVASLSFVSCSNDDDEPEVPQEAPCYPWVMLTYNYSEDFINYFDITYTISDFTGKTQTINVTKAGETNVTIEGSTTTCNATVSIDVKAKSTLVPDAEKKLNISAVSQLTYGFTQDGQSYVNGTGGWPFISGVSFPDLELNEDVIASLKKVYECSKTENFKFKDGAYQD